MFSKISIRGLPGKNIAAISTGYDLGWK